MKLNWSKILGLNNKILSQEGQEVEVLYEETTSSKTDKKSRKTLKESKKDFVSASEKGQIDIDLYEDVDKNSLVIKAKVPGVNSDNIDVVVEPDLIILRGNRIDKDHKNLDKHHYYYRECAWGEFLRRLILPCRVKPEKVDANLKQGILTVVLPKLEESSSHVKVK